ncbi:MAG: SNF2-related protein [Roseiarcus sp.]|jgi:superfamily II DNA or RNA helicase
MLQHPAGPLFAHLAPPADREAWSEKLADAFADRARTHGFLPLAEEAERACPGDAVILCQAAMAALLDRRPDKAQVYLKRYAKRYAPSQAYHLLSALALGAQNKLVAARALLERHNLTNWRDGMRSFPAGWERRFWLDERLDAIMGRERPLRARRPAVKPAAAKALPKSRPPTKPAAPQPAPAAQPALPALERLTVNIPVVIESNLRPLLAATAGQAESEGGWFALREQLGRFGLAQGFDELLCLPTLKGIETFWYQTETVRKVLKQFRGRVLLADEVGLGKTVEAGMALKEYLLRGMAERVLVLVPASLVGQWREELETKFDISCATTYDPLLREDPERFWAQPRIIASLALARRREHAERLIAQSFDIVIVDEAHHLRDRASQSYKLVDGLTKRFLLLLSATPVQNNLIELYNLLTLLKPGIFKTQKEFRAAYMTAGKPRQPANPERLRLLMRDAMIRNTRAVVALKLPRRHASTRCVDPTPAEQAAYQDLATLIRALAADGSESRHRMAGRHLLGAAGSSPAAATAALTRFAARHGGDPAWRQLAQRWAALGAGAKEMALIELLARNPAEKKLVFIHHRETMASLADLLARNGIAFARFEGGLSGPDKDAAIADFRERVSVLLCTESGGEGRNIQFCNTLINFDIPWNPMAIEQRIGRIDRIGQTREVFVFNLVARGTVEEQVLRLLDEKINMFELVVGEAGAILGDLDEERDFAELVLDAWLETTVALRAEAFDALGRRLDEARTQYSDAKALDDALFGEEFETA